MHLPASHPSSPESRDLELHMPREGLTHDLPQRIVALRRSLKKVFSMLADAFCCYPFSCKLVFGTLKKKNSAKKSEKGTGSTMSGRRSVIFSFALLVWFPWRLWIACWEPDPFLSSWGISAQRLKKWSWRQKKTAPSSANCNRRKKKLPDLVSSGFLSLSKPIG